MPRVHLPPKWPPNEVKTQLIKDWYWKVADSANPATTVFSSSRGDYVPLTDPDFQTWQLGGGMGATPRTADDMATEVALGTFLAQYKQAPAATTSQAIRDAYNDGLADGLGEAVIKVMFNHENRLRTLEAKPQLTPAQFKAALRLIMAGS